MKQVNLNAEKQKILGCWDWGVLLLSLLQQSYIFPLTCGEKQLWSPNSKFLHWNQKYKVFHLSDLGLVHFVGVFQHSLFTKPFKAQLALIKVVNVYWNLCINCTRPDRTFFFKKKSKFCLQHLLPLKKNWANYDFSNKPLSNRKHKKDMGTQ